jgi:cardiolipin synthase
MLGLRCHGWNRVRALGAVAALSLCWGVESFAEPRHWLSSASATRHQDLVGERIFDGNALELLENGPEFYPRRLEMIRSAKRSIDLITFLWCDDESGLTIARELAAAARRGVRVRIMIDAFNDKPHEETYRILSEAGAKPLVYNPLWWGIDRLNNRSTHEKVMIVDGEQALIGGANLCNEYMIGGRRGLWHDLELFIHGPLAARAQTRMDETWGSLVRQDTAARVRASQRFADPRNLPVVRPQYRLYPAATPVSRAAVGESEAMLVWQQSYLRDSDGRKGLDLFVDLIEKAESELVFYVPYFYPPKPVEDAIVAARARGVSVKVVTNSPRTNDVGIAVAAYHAHASTYLRAGVEIHEYQGRTMHAKALLVDGRLLSIGSHNLTPRSFSVNGEASVLTGDPVVLEKFKGMMARDLADSPRLTEETLRSRGGASVFFDIALVAARWVEAFM